MTPTNEEREVKQTFHEEDAPSGVGAFELLPGGQLIGRNVEGELPDLDLSPEEEERLVWIAEGLLIRDRSVA